ncbi:Hsp20/alpha crystallin family protein [Aquibacillus albus]|uniref:HSP20 family protein n=1 Tax=Aquibacillus albus TaxID=1168171 RepID=A0ABS2MXX3_9BACI|nr:Hsp20/alpha crystallin family protein [Aquibacillus albus]MBM7570540.1 HSP20 family protein [Aquibacillus albus]
MGEEPRRPKKKPDFQEMGSDFLRKMDDFFTNKPPRNILDSIDSFFQNQSLPARIPVDMFETDKEWIVKAELPGVNKEDIKVDISGDRVNISLTNDEDVKQYDEKHEFYQRERKYYHTERTVQLPYAIDKRTAKAKYNNGILEIRGPKKPRSNYHLDIE